MKMKEICARTGLTERAVRLYIDKGLLSPASTELNGRVYTEFSEADIRTLETVSALRTMRFSLSDIKTMLEDPASAADIARAHAKALSSERSELNDLADALSRVNFDAVYDAHALVRQTAELPAQLHLENEDLSRLSGSGERAVLPEEVMALKWNWGAFLFPVIWGLVNRTYIALLALLPIGNLIMPIYLGIMGYELAWRNNIWHSFADFRASQRRFSIGAACAKGLLIAVFVLSYAAGPKSSADSIDYEPYMSAALDAALADPEFTELTGGEWSWSGNTLPASAIAVDGKVQEIDFSVGSPEVIVNIRCRFDENGTPYDLRYEAVPREKDDPFHHPEAVPVPEGGTVTVVIG